ncbi:hypothetical protein GFGA_1d0838 [Gluconobacter frateurii NBRC 103465]|nr:hypothetical protein GFGA_1d0838 [Gluconobacter frateurii NBRC 103465]
MSGIFRNDIVTIRPSLTDQVVIDLMSRECLSGADLSHFSHGQNMQSIFDTLIGFILMLVGLIVAAISFIEVLARHALDSIGVHGAIQTVVLLILFVALVVGAFRIFGRLLAVLLVAAFVVYGVYALLGLPHTISVPGVPQDKTISF